MALGKLSTPAAQHAEAIRVLGRQRVANVIEIGRRLTEAKALAGHGGWLPWLEREFGWTVRPPGGSNAISDQRRIPSFAFRSAAPFGGSNPWGSPDGHLMARIDTRCEPRR